MDIVIIVLLVILIILTIISLFKNINESNITERLVLYKELNNLETDEELDKYQANIVDRFGPLPKSTEELIETIKLRRLAKEVGIEKLVLKCDTMICYFVSDPNSDFYKSKYFAKLIRFVQANAKIWRLKESKNKLSLVFDNIKSISQASNIITQFVEFGNK